MKLNQKQLEVIRDETLRVYPQEAVIVITKTGAIPLQNIHSDPVNHFEIDPKAFYKLKPVALVHSHTIQTGQNPSPDVFMYYDPRTPSHMDMATQLQLDLPFGIIAYDGETLTDIVWFPDLDADTIGKEYIHGVYDCYSIVRRYYWQNYKIKLQDYARSYDWWNNGGNLYTSNIANSDWVEIKQQDLREGDLILMRIKDSVECHAALYIGDDQLIHHLAGRLSTTDNFGRWRKKMTRFFKHKDKPEGNYKR